MLQVADNQFVREIGFNGERYAEAYKAAIDSLVASGLADPKRVGLTVFSAAGMSGLWLLAQYPTLLSAVNFSDAAMLGYLNELQQIEAAPDWKVQVAQAAGQPRRFTATGIFQWLQGNPIYNLEPVTAAVRLEAIAPGSVISMWETYAVLRARNHPAEFIYIPDDTHLLFRPSHRLASAEGAVDWFRFWLLGQEDPDQRKAAQYERWRRLRDRVP